MAGYRCYLMTAEIGSRWWRRGWRTTDATSLPASVSGLRKIEAGDDAHALAKSDELILECDVLAIEVWQRTRFVGRHTIAADIKIISGGRGAA
jgi:hypothetical protein